MGRRGRRRGAQVAVAGVLGFALGVVSGLLFAPKSGRDGRAWLGGQAARLRDGAGDAVGDAARSVMGGLRSGADGLRGGVTGLTRRLRSAADDEREVSDEVVLQRIRTGLGAMEAFAGLRGHYLLDVAAGVVTVRGDLRDPSLSAAFLAAVSGIPGVQAVESKLSTEAA